MSYTKRTCKLSCLLLYYFFSSQVKLYTEVSQPGVIGVRVSVITVLEQEHGPELDLVPTQHLLVMAGNHVLNVGLGWHS